MRNILVWSPALLEMQPYPGISDDESAVVRDWLRIHGHTWTHFEFQARVGRGDCSGPSLGDAVDRMWAAITRRRLDVVAYAPSWTWIVEAKVHAKFPAVTQLLRYARAWAAEHADQPLPMPLLIARSAERGVDVALQRGGGQLQLYPAGAVSPRVCV